MLEQVKRLTIIREVLPGIYMIFILKGSKSIVQDVDGELQYDYLLLQQTGTVVFLQEELPKTGLGITIKDLGFVNF